MLVRERCLNEGDVDRNAPLAEEIRDLREEDGGVVGETLVHGVACAVADEEGVVPEVVLELRVGVRRDSERPDVEDLRVAERLRVGLDELDQRLHQVLWLAASGADEDRLTPVDVSEGGLRGRRTSPGARGATLERADSCLTHVYVTSEWTIQESSANTYSGAWEALCQWEWLRNRLTPASGIAML